MSWESLEPFKTETGLAVYRMGEGQPLVLLHGVGLRSEAWSDLCEILRPDVSIHAIDLPGHGASESLNIANPDLQDYSDTIADYIASIGLPVDLIGHSMGAMIALDIAIRFPKSIKTVCTLNAIYQRSDVAAQAVQARAKTLKGLSQNDLDTETTLIRWFGKNPSGKQLRAAQSCRHWLHQTAISDYHKAYYVFAHYDGPNSLHLAALEPSALFITGSDEPNSTPAMSHAMAKQVPRGWAEIVSGAAHMMPMTHVSEVAAIIKTHIEG